MQTPLVNRDDEHLRVLSILHYVWGGLTLIGLPGFLCICPVGVGLMSVGVAEAKNEQQAVGIMAMGGAFMAIAAGFMALTIAWGVFYIYAGRCLAQKKHRGLCFAAAVLCLFSIPLGTLLGVFTLLVLSRPSVAQMFDQNT